MDMEDHPPRRTAAIVGLAVIVLLGGWHYLCRRELQSTLAQLSNELLHEHFENATALVDIGLLNNVVDIRVDLNTGSNSAVEKLVADTLVEAFKEQLEPEIERALQTRTRRAMDVYALLLPYKVSIVLGKPEPPSEAVDSGAGSPNFREVQQALAACGYDIGRADGVLGPRTQQAIRTFRIQHGLADSSIPLQDFPSLIRKECRATAPPPHIAQLIREWADVNNRCRGGSGDDPLTWTACEQRDELDQSIQAQGWCYGHESQPMSDRDWQLCPRGEQQAAKL